MKRLETTGEPVGALFHICNRGKKSVTLDLKEPEGQAALQELAKTADVPVFAKKTLTHF